MAVNKKIINMLFSEGLIQTKNPSDRDVANCIVGMYRNSIEYILETNGLIDPNAILQVTRGRIERAFGVVWENDIEPILRVIGFSENAEMNLIMQYWHK